MCPNLSGERVLGADATTSQLREWHRQRYTPKGGADDAPRSCTTCGKIYVPKQRRPSVYCSRKCKDGARHAASAAKREASKPLRRCTWCTGDMPKAMRADARFCSEQCNSAAHAVTRKWAKRRNVDKGELVSFAWFAERDAWRCGICGAAVPSTARHPDPLAGSLDHVVPLAVGGTNDPENIQLTHLRCNLRKGAGRRRDVAIA